MAEHVVIIGGGLAGLAAAAALGERGMRATLCESRPRWGGSQFVRRSDNRRGDRQLPARGPGLLYEFPAFLPDDRHRPVLLPRDDAGFYRSQWPRQPHVGMASSGPTPPGAGFRWARFSIVERQVSARPGPARSVACQDCDAR